MSVSWTQLLLILGLFECHCAQRQVYGHPASLMVAICELMIAQHSWPVMLPERRSIQAYRIWHLRLSASGKISILIKSRQVAIFTRSPWYCWFFFPSGMRVIPWWVYTCAACRMPKWLADLWQHYNSTSKILHWLANQVIQPHIWSQSHIQLVHKVNSLKSTAQLAKPLAYEHRFILNNAMYKFQSLQHKSSGS